MKLSWFAVPLAAALALAGPALSPAAAGGETVKLQTRPGVSVEFPYISQNGATAAVILSEGGGGKVDLRSASSDNGLFSRHRERFAKSGFAVALMNAPPDQKKFKGGMSPKFRRTKKHVKDVDATAQPAARGGALSGAKIAAFGGNAIEFLKPDGNPRFEATLLEGKQLPK